VKSGRPSRCMPRATRAPGPHTPGHRRRR
jgi:hypothetical protein